MQSKSLPPDRYNEVDLRVWEEPVPGARYAIGFDPAYGRNDNADNNVICVARCFADKWVQVAEYASNNHTAGQSAWVMAHLAGMVFKTASSILKWAVQATR